MFVAELNAREKVNSFSKSNEIDFTFNINESDNSDEMERLGEVEGWLDGSEVGTPIGC